MSRLSALVMVWILMVATLSGLEKSLSQEIPPPVRVLQPIAMETHQ